MNLRFPSLFLKYRNLYSKSTLSFCLKNFSQRKSNFGLNFHIRHLCSVHQPISDDFHQKSFNDIKSGVNLFTNRSHTCGEVNDKLVEQNVNLCGWIEFQRQGKFVVLRDGYGTVQLFIKDKSLQKILNNLYFESVISIKGKVSYRPEKDINIKQLNGNIEVIVDDLTVLNNSTPNIPFLPRKFFDVAEQTCLQYRYIDLRRPKMLENLRLRSKFINKLRNCLTNEFGFIEVETPTLFKPTPGGAQEFVVPTRFENHFYSLVQSPQQFKQLLMAGSIDRYFQIARCYRDEGTKSNRQPEFTQLDIEMSFTSVDNVIDLIENLIKSCWPIADSIQTPFKCLTYYEAMDKYGSDKPDLRSNIEIKLLSKNDSYYVYMFVVPQEYDTNFSIKDFIENELKDINRISVFNGKLNYFKYSSLTFQSDLSRDIYEELNQNSSFKPNDFLWIASGKKSECVNLLGRVRNICIEQIENSKISENQPRKFSFLWVHDFPLFLLDEQSKAIESAHHPFTSPKPSDVDKVYSDPLSAIGQSFDLVINGQEIGGGSIRIIDSSLQQYILKDILKCDTSPMEYFFEALDNGCPPHGGFAIGIDRLMAIICNARSIRDVIAFPKSANGKDLMANSPSPICDNTRKIYGL